MPAGAQMVSGDVEAGRRTSEACAACHGKDGVAANPAVPSIAGQPPLYAYYQLIQFKLGRRDNPQMAPVVANLSDQDMQNLALYYAAQKPAPAAGPSDPGKAVIGERLASEFFCNSCHRPDLSGQNQVPRITGLPLEYLLTQLRGYKAQTRADTDLAMTMAAQTLTEPDIEALAHYLAGLPRR